MNYYVDHNVLACINQSAALFCIMYMHGEASLSGFALCVKLGVSSCIGVFYMICCMFWATDDACFVPPVWFFLGKSPLLAPQLFTKSNFDPQLQNRPIPVLVPLTTKTVYF